MDRTANRPGSRLTKVAFLITIAIAFLRVTHGPAGGWSAVEFWLLLFYAAAMNGVLQNAARDKAEGDADSRAQPGHFHDNY